MKKIWTLLLFCNFLCATPLQERSIDPQALSELATKLGIPEDKDFIQETQKQWLRKPGQERWEMEEVSLEKRLFVLKWAEVNGLVSSWTPSRKLYDKALILGATTTRMQLRLNYLKKLWEEGVRFNEIVWLTGDRPLDARVDSFMDRCATESDAARIIWEETDLPEEMRMMSTLFLAVPMKKNGVRPSTVDTIEAWLKDAPSTCTALFVSNQPFSGYQYAVINATVPSGIHFDVVGPGQNPSQNPLAAAVILDSIARWIYTENQAK